MARRSDSTRRRVSWKLVGTAALLGLVLAILRLVLGNVFGTGSGAAPTAADVMDAIRASDEWAACADDVAITTAAYTVSTDDEVAATLADDPAMLHCVLVASDDEQFRDLMATFLSPTDAATPWSAHDNAGTEARAKRDWILRAAAAPGIALPGGDGPGPTVPQDTRASNLGMVMQAMDRLDNVRPDGQDLGVEARAAIELFLALSGLADDHAEWLETSDPGGDGTVPTDWLPTGSSDQDVAQVQVLFELIRRSRGTL